MARTRLILLICLTLLVVPFSVFADGVSSEEFSVKQPDPTIEVFADGAKVFFNELPIIENGTTIVQFRPIFEKLGLRVSWDAVTQTVYGVKDKFIITLQIGSPIATINGENRQLLLAPRIINGHTFVPLRFIGEASEKKVDWDGKTQTIQITSTFNSTIQDVLLSDDKKLKYEGELKNGKRNGEGKLFFLGNLWYEGGFQNNSLDGYGKLYDKTGRNLLYEGQLKKNRMDGQGIAYFINAKKSYEGQWSAGRHNGFGITYTELGMLYEGQLKNEIYDGKGKLFDPSTGKMIAQGTFKEGQLYGSGKIYDSSGNLKYDGELVSGKKNGKGKSYSNGILIYDGEYDDDLRNGQGTQYFSGGGKYVGGYQNGKFNGQGIHYDARGIISMQGTFKDSQFVDTRGHRPVVVDSFANGNVTLTDYSDGFSFLRTWTINLKWAKKITIGFRPEYYSIDYYPNELPNGSNFVTDGSTLLKIYKFSKADYEKNATSYNKLAENKVSVFAYILGTNLIANDKSHMAQYDEYNLLLEEMKKVVASFKVIDME